MRRRDDAHQGLGQSAITISQINAQSLDNNEVYKQVLVVHQRTETSMMSAVSEDSVFQGNPLML